MSYLVKVIVFTVDGPHMLEHVRKAVEWEGITVQQFTSKTAADGGKEIYLELRIGDPKVLGAIVRRVEGVKGAAIMAATEPKQVPISKRIER